MKKITKKQSELFHKDVLKILDRIGVKETTTDWKSMYKYTVQTEYGPLLVSVHSSQNVCYSIFARFADEKRIPPVLFPKPNRYSGKWNFHEYDANACLTCFEIAVKRIAVTGE